MPTWITKILRKFSAPAKKEARPSAEPSMSLDEIAALLDNVNRQIEEMGKKERDWTALLRRSSVKRVK